MPKPINIPLILTTTRLVVALIFPIVLIHTLVSTACGWHILAAGLFGLMCLTDFFDGYIARRYQQETLIGKLLDPVADKCLILATAVTLVYLHKISYYWVIVVFMRDMFVMGLREIALTQGFSVAVNRIGKLKTLSQMLYLMVVIGNCGLFAPYCTLAQSVLGWVSLSITVYSGYSYYRSFIVMQI